MIEIFLPSHSFENTRVCTDQAEKIIKRRKKVKIIFLNPND